MQPEQELDRLKAEYKALPLRDDAKRERLENELKTIIGLALPKGEQKRYTDQVDGIWFYPMAVWSGGPDMAYKSWPEGVARMVALIESIAYHLEVLGSSASVKTVSKDPVAMNKVFIVHGRDHGMLRDVDAFVRRIGIDPIILIDEPSRGGTVIEKVERNADVPFAIVLLSPDDIGRAFDEPKDQLKRRPRQNAVLELGFFIGRLKRENTALLVDATLGDDQVDYPSDLGGVIPIYYRPESDWKTKLMRELKASDIEHDPSRA